MSIHCHDFLLIRFYYSNLFENEGLEGRNMGIYYCI